MEAPIQRFLEPGFRPSVRWLPRPGRRGYQADPFGWRDPSGQVHVLCEDYNAATDRGHLAALTPGRGTYGDAAQGPAPLISVGRPLAGLPESLHCSSPYLLAEAGELFCVPECWESGEVRLYRALEPPTRWRLEAVLLPGVPGVDPTIFTHEGRWWLACTRHDRDADRDLYLWHAPALGGPWTAHRQQPAKSDYGSARPAGTPFRHQGALYRPAQDCSTTYGGAVVINRIRQLTPDAFAEEPAARLAPYADWPHRRGWHTLAAVGDGVTLVDAKRVVCLPAACRRALRRKLGRGLRRGPR
ncbi:MAG: glucosamine inositolphosphorylceramide transferase family protein [Terriglobales bacterium]